jgi:hypothetical protein
MTTSEKPQWGYGTVLQREKTTQTINLDSKPNFWIERRDILLESVIQPLK